jgi:hypothetical protein
MGGDESGTLARLRAHRKEHLEPARRPEDATRERAIVARSSPFLDARTFAAQFGTEEARNYMLEGLKKAGFR